MDADHTNLVYRFRYQYVLLQGILLSLCLLASSPALSGMRSFIQLPPPQTIFDTRKPRSADWQLTLNTIHLAEEAFDRGNSDVAEQFYRDAIRDINLELEANSQQKDWLLILVHCRHQLAVMYLDSNQLGMALDTALKYREASRQLAQFDPKDPEGQLRLAHSYLMAGLHLLVLSESTVDDQEARDVKRFKARVEARRFFIMAHHNLQYQVKLHPEDIWMQFAFSLSSLLNAMTSLDQRVVKKHLNEGLETIRNLKASEQLPEGSAELLYELERTIDQLKD